MELGDDQEGSIWLVVQLPQLVVSWWVVCWKHDNFNTVITVAPWNFQHLAIEVGYDVMMLENIFSEQLLSTYSWMKRSSGTPL